VGVVVAQVGARPGNDRIIQLSRTGDGIGEGARYQKALEEAMRQNITDIAQIRLDQVASPDVRALLAEVQQVIANDPQGAEAASTVNPDFVRRLSATEPANETE
jgi:hypothetical protein